MNTMYNLNIALLLLLASQFANTSPVATPSFIVQPSSQVLTRLNRTDIRTRTALPRSTRHASIQPTASFTSMPMSSATVTTNTSIPRIPLSFNNFFCDFENDTCGSSLGGSWRRQRGSTISSSTGPTDDATPGASTLYYVYYESSSPEVLGNRRRLIFPFQGRFLFQRGCLQFAYHMFGATIGTLRVFIVQDSTVHHLWNVSGNLGDEWRRTNVVMEGLRIPSLFSIVNFDLVFEAENGGGFQGDIAIDDVRISLNCFPLGTTPRSPTTSPSNNTMTNTTITTTDTTISTTTFTTPGFTTTPLPHTSAFLPFGRQNGDSFVRSGDDVATCTRVSSNFPLFNSKGHTQICMNSNGVITIDRLYTSTTIRFPTTFTVLAAYSLDMRSSGSDISYRITSDQNILNLVDRDIALISGKQPGTQSPFNARSVFVVTYNNIRPFRGSGTYAFQAIIATDFTRSFTIVNYKTLNSNNAVTAGVFEPGKCENTKLFASSTNTRSLVFTSNVGIPGKHVYSLVNENDCINNQVMYPFGRSSGDAEISTFSQTTNFRLPPLKGNWAFFSRRFTNSEISVNSRGSLQIGNRFYTPPTTRMTYIAPYYRTFSGQITISYRETNNQTMLDQLTADIQSNSSDEFVATYAYIITFRSLTLKFQMALATNSSDTYAVMNYEQLDFDAFHVGMNERGCGLKTFQLPGNSADKLIRGNSTGVRGRHVFSLTTKGCFRTVSGVRVISASFFASQLFTSYSTTLNVLKPNENGNILVHVIDAVTNRDFPMSTSLIQQTKTQLDSFLVHYGIFKSQLSRSSVFGLINNLFVLTGTQQTTIFQYGMFTFPIVESMTVCNDVNFEGQMDSVPSVKMTPRIERNAMEEYIYVWLQNVTSVGFTVCAKEVIAFSGKRIFSISYIATTKMDKNIAESEKIIISSTQSTKCIIKKLQNIYISIPSVFVTPELDSYEPVVSWIKKVTLNEVEICSKSTNTEAIKVHIIVNGKISPCTGFKCPNHLECQLIGNNQPICNCIKSCVGKEGRGEFCGSNYLSHASLCDVNKQHCQRYGNNSKSNVTVTHYGKCQLRPFQAGRTILQSVAEMPGVFCKYITIDQTNFLPSTSSSLKVLLTVSWDQSLFTIPNDASASWSEDVTTRGFKACALIAGRHKNSDFPSPPVVHWTVLQKEFLQNQALEVGSISLSTWYTGTQCKTVKSTSIPVKEHLITSIHHTKPKSYQNAMTVWTEFSRIDVRRFDVRVCARELQNFDGKHEGIVVHWLLSKDSSPYKPFIPELIVVNFPSKIISIGQKNPAECKTIAYNLNFPSLPNPTVLIGGFHQQFTPTTTLFSQHDFAVWLEQTTKSEVTVCMKSMNTISNQRPSFNVNVIVVATLCEGDSNYHNGSCYQKLPNCHQWEEANHLCQANGGTLPIISNEEESIFLQERISTTTWLNIRRSPPNTGPLIWGDGSMITFNKWFPGQPRNTPFQNCAVMDQRGNELGWKEEHCQSCKHTICEKDANLEERTCNHFCLNGGSCRVSGQNISSSRSTSEGSVSCSCPSGFAGVRCQIDVSQIEGCFNYTTHREEWRNVNGNSTVQSNTTSCDATMLTNGWHRFSGAAGTQLYTRCPSSVNKCGTQSPGWVVGGVNPTMLGESRNRKLHFRTFYCADDFGSVQVKNCGNFLSYRFINIPFWSCNYGLCTV